MCMLRFLSNVNQVQHRNEASWEDMQTLHTVVVIFMKYSRLHSGGGTPGYVAEFPSKAIVQVVVDSPISSKPGSQL